MNILLSVLICFFSFMLNACGTLATKGDLGPVSEFPKLKKTGTLLYRAINLTPRSDKSLSISTRSEEKLNITATLQSTKMFSKVTIYQPSIEKIYLKPDEIENLRAEVMKIKFPIEADYFLDLQYKEKFYGPESFTFPGFLHLITFGLLPIAFNNDVHLNAILYDQNGKKLQENKLDNESTVWHWLPLFFFNGFHLVDAEQKATVPVQKNTLDHAVAGLKL